MGWVGAGRLSCRAIAVALATVKFKVATGTRWQPFISRETVDWEFPRMRANSFDVMFMCFTSVHLKRCIRMKQ